MRIFWKEHLPFVLLNLFNMIILFLFYRRLGGFSTVGNVYYFLFLSTFLLGMFLLYRYFTHRRLYDKLSSRPAAMEDLLAPAGEGAMAEALDRLLRAQYSLYQEQIQQYRRKQEEHLAFMHQWVHQMKTPISVMHLILQENEGEPYVDSIRQELDRLQRGLNMVLHMARLNSFPHDFKVETVVLYPLVVALVNEHKRYFIRKRVYPEVQVEQHLAVNTDRKWLKFVLEQLLVNAIKYTDGEHKKVTVVAYRAEQGTVLEVRDRGVGIPPQDIRRVFEPFYTGENGRRFGESTGMGLYLVYEVCRRLEHRLELESRPGEGTTVRLIFQG